MTHQFPWRHGELFGFRYVFEAAGDGLPEHTHTPELEHDVCVMRGRVAIIFEDIDVEVLEARDRLTFNSARVHRIIALTPAEIINKIHKGLPFEYAVLTDAELSGEIEAPIDFYLEGT